jgi:hypothetical protein
MKRHFGQIQDKVSNVYSIHQEDAILISLSKTNPDFETSLRTLQDFASDKSYPGVYFKTKKTHHIKDI